MRSLLYRFPDLAQFEQAMSAVDDAGECEFDVPAGETVDDGEWVLAIFELGAGRRATSAAGRAVVSPEGARLVLEPRDWRRLGVFARTEARRGLTMPPPPEPLPANDAAEEPHEPTPETARSPAPSRVAGARAPTSGARVLIVDDDPDIRDVVSAMLEAVDLRVIALSSAEDALAKIRAEPFDLLVLDWNLPKMTGLDLCRLIRKEPGLASLPVLFLTANASSQDMVEAFASGGDDYVVKPFRAPELGARIFALLRRARR